MKYRNLENGIIVDVVNVKNDFSTLSDGSMIDTSLIMNENYYERVNENLPNTSPNVNGEVTIDYIKSINPFSGLIEQIKNIDTTKFSNDDSPNKVENIYEQTIDDIEEEKRLLAQRYGIPAQNNNTLYDVESYENGNDLRVSTNTNNITENIGISNPSYTVESNNIINNTVDKYQMFKGIKRNVDIKIPIIVDTKLPRIDFIEMMEDSYEESIIEYLSIDITNTIINDPEIIKGIVESTIRNMVYPPKKKTIKKTVSNTEISVDDNKPAKKVRTKKTQVNND